MIENLRQSNKWNFSWQNPKAIEHIITPFSPYFIADYYVGYEFPGIMNQRARQIRAFADLSKIKDFDIVHVQVDYIPSFVSVLDLINARFILMTGQFHHPALERGYESDILLKSPKVLLWFSQNPIYPESDKYRAFPYGISPLNLDVYVNALLSPRAPKTQRVAHLHVNPKTNRCRKKLPYIDPLAAPRFYEEIARADFLISPIGDRHDCFRHYEAIGLGTVPISNVGKYYKPIFTDSMIYVSDVKLEGLANGEALNEEYKEPNKDLICLEYHKKKVLEDVALLRGQLKDF